MLMTSQVLQIDSSIKGDQSVTRHLTKAVLARLMHRDAGRRLIYRDLAICWKFPPPRRPTT
jgi:FMN-dependent NADH-azoreductase